MCVCVCENACMCWRMYGNLMRVWRYFFHCLCACACDCVTAGAGVYSGWLDGAVIGWKWHFPFLPPSHTFLLFQMIGSSRGGNGWGGAGGGSEGRGVFWLYPLFFSSLQISWKSWPLLSIFTSFLSSHLRSLLCHPSDPSSVICHFCYKSFTCGPPT